MMDIQLCSLPNFAISLSLINFVILFLKAFKIYLIHSIKKILIQKPLPRPPSQPQSTILNLSSPFLQKSFIIYLTTQSFQLQMVTLYVNLQSSIKTTSFMTQFQFLLFLHHWQALLHCYSKFFIHSFILPALIHSFQPLNPSLSHFSDLELIINTLSSNFLKQSTYMKDINYYYLLLNK